MITDADVSAPFEVFTFTFDDRPGQHLLNKLRAAGHRRPLAALVQALSASPPARRLSNGRLFVREEPRPSLVFAGSFEPAERARLTGLGHLLRAAGSRLRLLDWSAVEHAVDDLAQRLRDRLGAEGLDGTKIVGVPRGGLIVAALLAYTLGVNREHLGTCARGDTVILVDDCILSGVRISEAIASCPASTVIVATLFASPEVHRKVEGCDERVLASVAGVDLVDHGADVLGRDYAEWIREWEPRVDQRLHTALLDLVVFPWNEPEIRLWNAETAEIEPHWWLAPEASCFAHRNETPAIDVHFVDELPGCSRLLDHVVPIYLRGGAALIDTVGQDSVYMSDSTHALLDAWLACDDIDEAAHEVAERYEVPEEVVRADLVGLLEDLAERGLVHPSTPISRARGADRS